MYVAKRGDSIPLVARHYLTQTSYLTSSELADAIRKRQRRFRGTFLKAGQPVIIPGHAGRADCRKVGPGAARF